MTPETLDRLAPRVPASSALRTMRPTEVLDEALRTYRILAPVLLRRSAVPAVLVLASVLFWTRAFGPRLFTTNAPGDVAAQVGEAGLVLAAGLLVAGPLFVFGVTEGTLQAVALAGAYREGRWKGEAAAGAEARRAFPRAFGAGLLAFLTASAIPVVSFAMMAFGGLLAAATPSGDETPAFLAGVGGIGFFVGLIVAAWAGGAYALVPAAALRGDGPRAACGRSRRLMRGDARVLGGGSTIWLVYFVLFIAALAEWGGIALVRDYVPFAKVAPGGGLFSEALGLASPFVVAWTLLPLWGTAVAVLDGERRVRKEGYDVELLSKG